MVVHNLGIHHRLRPIEYSRIDTVIRHLFLRHYKIFDHKSTQPKAMKTSFKFPKHSQSFLLSLMNYGSLYSLLFAFSLCMFCLINCFEI